jgi:hypothetical protein
MAFEVFAALASLCKKRHLANESILHLQIETEMAFLQSPLSVQSERYSAQVE